MNNILSITSNAAFQIKKILSSAPDGIDSIVVGIDKSGCSGYSYKLDYANSSNLTKYEKIVKDDITVFVDPKATMYLLGSVMDYRTDKLSTRFIFDNPNEKNSCGCGESFSI